MGTGLSGITGGTGVARITGVTRVYGYGYRLGFGVLRYSLGPFSDLLNGPEPF